MAIRRIKIWKILVISFFLSVMILIGNSIIEERKFEEIAASFVDNERIFDSNK